MPKICCFFEKSEEIKKKLNKIKKLMGETFQNLRAHGKSVVLERQKNIVIERSEDSIVTRKQTIIREKILNDENTFSSPRKPHKPISNTAKVNPDSSARTPGGAEQIVNSKRTTTTTTTASPVDSAFLPSPTKAFSALELAALKQDIDDEITNLKLQRNTLLKQAISTARENAKMREKKPANIQIQNDMTWDQNFSAPPADTIELQFEKFSSEHNVQSTVRHKRDEQTSCRPRMRTIGLQKNTQRSAVVAAAAAGKSKHLPIHNSLLNLKYNSTCEAIPTAFACFDYGPNCAVNEYYQNPSNSHSGCHSYCQRYNLAGNYNGVMCNQNTYRQQGRTPCTEYNYCRDEYYYDYSNMTPPQQQSHVQDATVAPPMCCCHGDCCANNHRRKRRGHAHHYEHKKDKVHRINECDEQLLTKKYLLQQISKQQRDLEREEARELAIRAAKLKLDHFKTQRAGQRDKKQDSAARLAALITRGKLSNKKPARDDSDSDGEERYQLKKEKLKVTKKQSYKLKKAASPNVDLGYCEDISSDGTRQEEYNIETKRTLEKMRIHAYKPSTKRDKEGLSQVTQASGQGVKKEKRYAEYITQYKQDPLTTNLEVHQNIRTSLALTPSPNRLESVADEVGLITKATDLKSTQTSAISPRLIPKMYSNKRISAHDGNELWESPINEPQSNAPKRLTKEDSAQTDKLTPKPADYKRLSSVGTNSPPVMRSYQTQYEQPVIKEDRASSPLMGSFLSRDDAYQRASKKGMIPADLSPLERLAREETLSQDSRGQSIHEQLSMRDHLFRGEYLPLQDAVAYPDKSIDEKLSVRDRIPKVESFDAGDREATIQEPTYLERVPTSDRVLAENAPEYSKVSPRESLKQTMKDKITPHSSVMRDQTSPRDSLIRSRTPREGSYNVESRKFSAQEERTPRKHLKRDGSYAAESPKISTQIERKPREDLRGERSYTTDSRKLGTAEERTPREYSRREGSLDADSRKISSHEERAPRDYLTREGSYTVDTRMQSIQEERIPQERSSREGGSYTADSRKLNAHEERTPRDHLRREGSFDADARTLTTPREYNTRGGSYAADSRKLSSHEKQSPRDYFKGEESYDVPTEHLLRTERYSPQSQKLSLGSQEERTTGEQLRREGSYNAESRKLSNQEMPTPYEHSLRGERYVPESRKQGSYEERTPREYLRGEGSYTAESRKLNTQEESLPGENLVKDGSHIAQRQKRSAQEERTSRNIQDESSPKRTPREQLAGERSYNQDAQMHSPRERLSREPSFLQDTLKQSIQQERTPRERSAQESSFRSPQESLTRAERYIKDTIERLETLPTEERYNRDTLEPSSHERSQRVESYSDEKRKQSMLEYRSPRERLSREARLGSQLVQDKLSPREHSVREDSLHLENRISNIQKERAQEPLSRAERYGRDSPRRSTQEDRTTRERLLREEGFGQGGRVLQENLSPRERLTREDSIIKHSPKEKEELEHKPREGSYIRDGPIRTIQEQRTPREHMSREASFIQEREESSRKGSTPRERLSREASFIKGSRVTQDNLSPREHMPREESSRRESTLEKRTPRERVSREASFMQGSRVMQDNLSPREQMTREESRRRESSPEKRTPREREKTSREGSFMKDTQVMQDSLSPRTEQHTPRRRLSREASFLQGSRIIEDNLSPRQSLAKEESYQQDNQKKSTSHAPQESSARKESQRTPRESLTREGSFSPDKRRQSSPEKRSPRGSLTRERSFSPDKRRQSSPEKRSPRGSATKQGSFSQAKRRQSSPEKRSPRGSLTKEDTHLQDSPKRNTQDQRSPRVTKDESFVKGRREQNTLDHKPLRKRFKDSVHEKVIPQARLAKKEVDQQRAEEQTLKTHLSPRDHLTQAESGKRSIEDTRSPRESSTKKDSFLQGGQDPNIRSQRTEQSTEDEETNQQQQQVPTIQLTAPKEESNFEVARSPRGSLRSTTPQTLQPNALPRPRSPREDSSFIASQLKRDSASSRRLSSREGSFAQSSRIVRDTLTRQRTTKPAESARRSTYITPEIHRRSTLHLPDRQSIRRSTLHLTDIARASAINLPDISRQSSVHISDSRRRSTHLNQPPRWTKDEVLYPYMTYSQEPREPYAFRRSNIPQDSQIQIHEPPKQETTPHQETIPPPKKIPEKIVEEDVKKDEPRKSLPDTDCETPPDICPEICDDTPYECVPCFVEPETPCLPVYDACQTFNKQNEICYDQPSINAQTYHKHEVLYTTSEYNPYVTSCYGRIPALGFQNNNYDERPTTTTTASSQASYSDYQPYRPPQQMLICVNPLEQQSQAEDQPSQMRPTIMPQFIPSQQFETEEQLLQRLDLESRMRCCDAIQQENMYYCDGDEIKYANYEPTIDQNYTEDEECRYDRDIYNNIDFPDGNYEQTMQDYMERRPSNCTVTSAYATASSGVSCTGLSNNEDMDPPEQFQQHHQSNQTPNQNRIIPEYTGCPCMLATYLEMMGLNGSNNEMPKQKDECVKRISFR